MTPNERVATVRQEAKNIADQNGWVKDKKLTQKNGRDVYDDVATEKNVMQLIVNMAALKLRIEKENI